VLPGEGGSKETIEQNAQNGREGEQNGGRRERGRKELKGNKEKKGGSHKE